MCKRIQSLLVHQLKTVPILVLPTGISQKQQKGTGELSIDLNCQLLVVFPASTPEVQLTIREAVMSLCLEIEQQRFGLQVKPLQFVSAEPDAFNPELDECEVWSLRWIHEIDISGVDKSLLAEVFNPNGKSMAGYEPNIGLDHQPDYEPIFKKVADV